MPAISVIIPAYNAGQTIATCLEALQQQTASPASYEIIVVDDGSVDETRAIVANYPDVRLITQNHAGPAAARNLGVQHAQGEIVLFTDADCAPAADWIERMTAPFRYPGIVGVKGAYLTGQQSVVARFVQLEYEDKYARMARDRYIDFVDTYAAGYRREVFIANGGFDTAFPLASVEDQEFSFRLAQRGYKMVFVPGARVRHLRHADSLPAYWRKKFRIGYWKVKVHKRHPTKLFRDSHTPQILKAQIGLIGLAGLGLLGGVFSPLLKWAALIAGAAFLLTTLPFAIKARQDPVVALVSPALLFVRAVALGSGFAAGLISQVYTGLVAGKGKGV